MYEAELYRLRGELLLQQVPPDASQAEHCFQQALAIARRQQAKSFELRAAMSLSHLWQCQGKRADAYAMLAEVYGWFTEGFDTADPRRPGPCSIPPRGGTTWQGQAYQAPFLGGGQDRVQGFGLRMDSSTAPRRRRRRSILAAATGGRVMVAERFDRCDINVQLQSCVWHGEGMF